MSSRPLVIAHRGASGYRPEHTLAAYRLAAEMGADFIEPDLVATADGVLVARHENALAVLATDGSLDRSRTTTDVHLRPEFASRLTGKTVDGRPVRGWFSEDFTLAELKRLRAVERLPALRPANTRWDGQFEIPTFDEVLELADTLGRTLGRRLGVYPETKHPSWFAREGKRLDGGPIGCDLGARLVSGLVAAGFTDPARVFIQSFECANLQALARDVLPRAGLALPLVQLVDATGAPRDFELGGDPRTYADLVTPAGCEFVAGYAQALGVPKSLVLDGPAPRRPGRLVGDAHASCRRTCGAAATPRSTVTSARRSQSSSPPASTACSSISPTAASPRCSLEHAERLRAAVADQPGQGVEQFGRRRAQARRAERRVALQDEQQVPALRGDAGRLRLAALHAAEELSVGVDIGVLAGAQDYRRALADREQRLSAAGHGEAHRQAQACQIVGADRHARAQGHEAVGVDQRVDRTPGAALEDLSEQALRRRQVLPAGAAHRRVQCAIACQRRLRRDGVEARLREQVGDEGGTGGGDPDRVAATFESAQHEEGDRNAEWCERRVAGELRRAHRSRSQR
jgi:glycerophosphoryl diester phosphodiesterase